MALLSVAKFHKPRPHMEGGGEAHRGISESFTRIVVSRTAYKPGALSLYSTVQLKTTTKNLYYVPLQEKNKDSDNSPLNILIVAVI